MALMETLLSKWDLPGGFDALPLLRQREVLKLLTQDGQSSPVEFRLVVKPMDAFALANAYVRQRPEQTEALRKETNRIMQALADLESPKETP